MIETKHETYLYVNREIDGLLETIKNRGPDFSLTRVLSKTLDMRLRLARDFCFMPETDRRSCVERLDLYDKLVRDYINLERVEEIEGRN